MRALPCAAASSRPAIIRTSTARRRGPGRQVVIGGPGAEGAAAIRDLLGDLALLPVEGGARVAIIATPSG